VTKRENPPKTEIVKREKTKGIAVIRRGNGKKALSETSGKKGITNPQDDAKF